MGIKHVDCLRVTRNNYVKKAVPRYIRVGKFLVIKQAIIDSHGERDASISRTFRREGKHIQAATTRPKRWLGTHGRIKRTAMHGEHINTPIHEHGDFVM
jgi:hypothetical protein